MLAPLLRHEIYLLGNALKEMRSSWGTSSSQATKLLTEAKPHSSRLTLSYQEMQVELSRISSRLGWTVP